MIESLLDRPVPFSYYQSLIGDRVLPPDSPMETIFEVTADSGKATGAALRALHHAIVGSDVDVKLCYCSVYEECWTASMQEIVKRSRGIKPPRSRQVESCRDRPESGI